MKPHRIFCLGLGLGLTAFTAKAQQDSPAAQANLNALVAGSSVMLPRGEAYGLTGSPYADARWLPARITLTNNLPLAPVPLKYDVLNRRLLMRPATRPNDSLQLDDQRVLRFVLLEPATGAGAARQREFRRFEEAPSPNHRLDYVEVLHAGTYTLLKHYLKKLRKADYQGPYSTDRRFDEVEDNPAFYLRSPDGRVAPVKLASKSLEAAAPPLAAALKTAAAARKPKTEADWAAVLDAADPAAK